MDQAASPSRQAGHRSGCSRPRAPFGPGEPQVGLPADQRGAPRPGHPGVCHHHRHCPSGPSSRSRSAARADVEGIPHPTSLRDHRLRLPHRGDGLASDAVCAVFRGARDKEGARGRSDPESGFGLGHPASTKRRRDTRRTGDLPSLPYPRPGHEVLRLLRRGVQGRRHQDHLHADPGPERERLRREVGGNRSGGVSGLDADPRTPPPGTGPSDLRPAFQRPPASPGPEPEGAGRSRPATPPSTTWPGSTAIRYRRTHQ